MFGGFASIEMDTESGNMCVKHYDGDGSMVFQADDITPRADKFKARTK